MLHWAVDCGSIELTKKFIDLGIDINFKDNTGQTALHYAVICSHDEISQILIANGADINIRDDLGETPKDIMEAKNK